MARGLIPFCLVPLFGLGGCGSSKDEPAEATCPEGSTCLTDENNYWSKTDLTLPIEETATGDTNFDICWGGVSDDLQCHGVTPETDIITVTFLEFVNMDKDQVTEILNSGVRPDPGTIFTYEPDGDSTCMEFTDFHTVDGAELDPEKIFQRYQEGDNTYVLTFSTSETLGAGTKTMLFLEPNSDSDNTAVDASPGCDDSPLLDYEVDIASKPTLEIPMDGPWIVDWSQATMDSVGNDIPSEHIDRVLLGFYEGYSVGQIEDEIYDIEDIGELWEIEFEGKDRPTSIDLADVTPVGDEDPFDGFDRGDGTWLFALMCSTCSSPAPVVLTVLEPTSGAD